MQISILKRMPKIERLLQHGPNKSTLYVDYDESWLTAGR